MARQPPTITAPAKLLIPAFDAHDEWRGEPLHDAVVRALDAHGIAGGTVLHGVTGYGAHHAVRRRGPIGPPQNKPTVILIVENAKTLRGVRPTTRPTVPAPGAV